MSMSSKYVNIFYVKLKVTEIISATELSLKLNIRRKNIQQCKTV